MFTKFMIMGECRWESSEHAVMDNGLKSHSGKLRVLRFFNGEQSEFGYKADVCQGDSVANQALTGRLEAALNTRHIDAEGIFGSGVNVGGHRATGQGQQIDL